MPKKEKEMKNSEQSVLEESKVFRERQYTRAVICILIFVFLGWLLGRLEFGFFWLLALILLVIFWWRSKISWLLELVCKDADLEARRDRAFQDTETVEWLNFILNRWIIYSDESLLLLIKNSLDPLLEASLPSFIGSIEVSDFTLGTRTPYIRHIKAYDSFDDLQKLRATAFSMRQPPDELMTRQKYRVVLDLDIGLASPDARFVLRIRLGNKGRLATETDIAVEDFYISGKMQLVLQFNRNIPFPHLASLSFCFLQEPQVLFDIRMLKAVQLMDVPLVRQWVSQMVNDTLRLSLVDPDRIYIPLCDDPDEVARGSEFACGVLTLSISGGKDERPTDDPYWCVVSLGNQKINTKDVTSDGPWSDHVSLLVHNLHYDRLTIKIKGKRKLGTKYTVTQYDMPLARLCLDTSPEQEKVFEKENSKGLTLNVNFTYTALPLVSIPAEEELNTDEEREEIVKNMQENIFTAPVGKDEVSGVLLVVVHSGESLIPMDKNGLSDPYCMVYANRSLVNKTDVVKESLDPVWNSMAEFPVVNVSQVTLSFLVHDKDENALKVKDDDDDFLGSCNLKMSKDFPVILRKELHLLYKLKSSMKTSGKLCVSVVFRPVASIRKSWKPEVPGGFPEGEPVDEKSLKVDLKFMEALLMAERGAICINIHRGRNLVAMDLTGKSDPFVTLRTDDGTEKFRSKVQNKTLNPVWSETATIAMPADGEQVILDVWDKDTLSQEKMGSSMFSATQLKELTKEQETKHWFKLTNTKSGEVQLSFKYITPETTCHSLEYGFFAYRLGFASHEKTHEYGCDLNKESYSIGNDTWSEMGKHCNVTKEVYYCIQFQECSQVELNNNMLMNGEPESVRPEDLDQDLNRKSGWKVMLKKPRVFGITAFSKKSSSSRPSSSKTTNNEAKKVEEKVPEKAVNVTPEIPKSSRTHSARSSTSSHEELLLTNEERSNLVNGKQVRDSTPGSSEVKAGKDSKTRPKLLSVVNSAKSHKTETNSWGIPERDDGSSSVQDADHFDDIDELLGGKNELKEASRHWKMKGVRKRLRSWRGKKQRSVSESDVIRAIEKENHDDDDDDAKELLEAWFDSSDSGKDEKKSEKIKKHYSVGSVEGKNTSPDFRRQSHDVANIRKRGYSLGDKEKRKNKNLK